jgi:ERCC4-type nuclease
MDGTRRTGTIPQTILRDTRERRPWTFDGCAVETRDVTLSTGDYAVPAHCDHDPDADTYHPQFAIERKSGQDFLDAITWERDRFTAELRRAAEWPAPLTVVVEESWESLLRGRGCMAWRDIHPNQIVGTLSAWTRHYNATVRFTGDRRRAELCAYLILVRHDLRRQTGDC